MNRKFNRLKNNSGEELNKWVPILVFWRVKGRKLPLMTGFALVISLLMVMFPQVLKARDKSGRITTVVIDAGHGGKDPGALGRNSSEKDITLKVALKTGELIRRQHPDVKVVFTRTKDEFIELHRRAEIANKEKADLFISIHCNAHKSRSHYGAETFVMGLHRSQANLDVARFENAAILYEDDYKQNYQGFDPNSPESYIIFSMYQNIFREQSLLLASLLQNELGERSRRFDRGVKEAGFLVLYRTTMPSVLVELGFITNANEEEFLRSPAGQQQLAESLAAAFTRYREHTEQNAKPREIISQTRSAKSNLVDSSSDIPSVSASSSETLSVAKITPPDDSQGVAYKPSESKKEQTPTTVTTVDRYKVQTSAEKVIWRVQILTSGSKLSVGHPKFHGITDVYEYFHQGSWKYTTGSFPTEEEALQYRNQIRSKGFSDAFIVPFAGNQRITLEEARKLQGK